MSKQELSRMQTISSAALLSHRNIRIKKTRFGLMLYNIHDMGCGRCLDQYGEFSVDETEVFAHLVEPGMVVLDIGANIGAFTVFLSQAVGPEGEVIAFEPQRVLYQILVANLALNEINNVRPFQAGAGHETGQAAFPPIDYATTGWPGAVSLQTEANGETVVIMPIDSLALPQCHFMKIDVEGFEEKVLVGARETIRTCRPAIYIENDRPNGSESLIGCLQSFDYAMYWHTPLIYSANNFYGNPTNHYPRTCSINMVCLPNEVSQTVQGLRPVTDPTDWPLDTR